MNSCFYKDILGLKNTDIIEYLDKSGTKRSYSRGEYIVYSGDVKNQIYFLIKGVVISAILLENGEEKIGDFYHIPGSVMLPSFSVLDYDVPASFDLVATEDCEILVLPLSVFQKSMNDYAEVQAKCFRRLSRLVQAQWKLQLLLKKSTAKERYLWFLDNYPGLIYRVSSKHVASFLGMDPATLSKVKHNN